MHVRPESTIRMNVYFVLPSYTEPRHVFNFSIFYFASFFVALAASDFSEKLAGLYVSSYLENNRVLMILSEAPGMNLRYALERRAQNTSLFLFLLCKQLTFKNHVIWKNFLLKWQSCCCFLK